VATKYVVSTAVGAWYCKTWKELEKAVEQVYKLQYTIEDIVTKDQSNKERDTIKLGKLIERLNSKYN